MTSSNTVTSVRPSSGTPEVISAATAAAFRAAAAVDLAHGRTDSAVEVLRVAACLRPSDDATWAELAEALDRAGEVEGGRVARKIVRRLRAKGQALS